MLSTYSQLKNHLDLFKKYLSKMNVLEELNLPHGALEEPSLKASNPAIFLRLLHYVIVDFSHQFYKWVLEEANFVAINDKKFVENVVSLARRRLGMEVNITVEQFLTAHKYLLQKVEFVGNISKLVYQWGSSKKKSTKQVISIKKQSEEEEDEDFEQPRQITVKPTKDVIIGGIGTSKQRLSKFMDAQEGEIQGQTNKLNQEKMKKPNIFPKSFKQNQSQEETKVTTKINIKQEQNHPSPSSADPVTREQFNEMLEMLSTVNSTVTNIVDKFNNFQGNVIGWINNINAKIGIMEENIKMIKNNF